MFTVMEKEGEEEEEETVGSMFTVMEEEEETNGSMSLYTATA